ncbi:MAG TPA: TetR/AcrR family transcriptional regulator [Solirubrobacteraceae bacterium]|nr:TetR/AcrR family transcriptional regulator [Solirubrobacteraceae bacterium]
MYDAAMARFAEVGVAATRVEDVVSAAGVAWGTFYRYFPRKEDVLLEAAARQFREQLEPLVESDLRDPTQTTRERLLRLFVAMLEPGEHQPRVRAEMIKEVLENRGRFSAMLDSGPQPLLRLVASILEEGQRRGEVRTDTDRFTLAAVLAIGVIYSVTYAYYGEFRPASLTGGREEFRGIVERFFAVIWRGLEGLEGESGHTEPASRSEATTV